MLSLLRLARKQTNSSNPFRIRTFFFLSCSFETETINIRSYTPVGSLENHTRFQTKTAQKPYTDGAAHTYVAYIREYPPPGCIWTSSRKTLSLMRFSWAFTFRNRLLVVTYGMFDCNNNNNNIIIIIIIIFLFNKVWISQGSSFGKRIVCMHSSVGVFRGRVSNANSRARLVSKFIPGFWVICCIGFVRTLPKRVAIFTHNALRAHCLTGTSVFM